MPDLRFDISENGLEQLILPLDDELVVEDILHGLLITHLGIDRQPLDLGLILVVVEYGLRNDNVGINFRLQVSKIGPVLAIFHLQAVKHESVSHLLSYIANVIPSHDLQRLLLFRLEVSNLVFSILGDGANRGTPPVHFTSIRRLFFLAPIFEVLVLNQSLHVPVVLSVLLPPLSHIKSKLLAIVFVGVVDFSGDSDTEAALTIRSKECRGSAADMIGGY